MPIDTCIVFEMFQKQFSSVYVSKFIWVAPGYFLLLCNKIFLSKLRLNIRKSSLKYSRNKAYYFNKIFFLLQTLHKSHVKEKKRKAFSSG